MSPGQHMLSVTRWLSNNTASQAHTSLLLKTTGQRRRGCGRRFSLSPQGESASW
ncbi:hypothetical protein LEMLEM_LOCUS6518 [Lemmus lemmus]